MRTTAFLLAHRVPLIKFTGGLHQIPKNLDHSTRPHPCSPSGELPKSFFSSASAPTPSAEPKEGEYSSRSELPKRFRYTFPSELEIDDVNAGGAEVVF